MRERHGEEMDLKATALMEMLAIRGIAGPASMTVTAGSVTAIGRRRLAWELVLHAVAALYWAETTSIVVGLIRAPV
jgi:hypothetical protein